MWILWVFFPNNRQKYHGNWLKSYAKQAILGTRLNSFSDNLWFDNNNWRVKFFLAPPLGKYAQASKNSHFNQLKFPFHSNILSFRIHHFYLSYDSYNNYKFRREMSISMIPLSGPSTAFAWILSYLRQRPASQLIKTQIPSAAQCKH